MNGSLLLLRSPIVWLALGCSLSTPWGASLASAVTEQQRAQVAELVAGVQAAGQLYSAGEFLDAASRIAQLQESLVALLQSPDPSLHRMVRPIYARLARAHALLELEGAELAALPTWEELTSAQETPAGESDSPPPPPTEKPASGGSSGDSPSPGTSPGMVTTPPSGGQTVSFAKDIAPLLQEHCQGCHIAGQQASGNLRMDSFAQLTRGGDSGAPLDVAKPNNSLLLKKLRGEAGQRMPAGGRPPLPDEQIQLIATWIGEGARYDGPNPDTNIETVVNQAWAEEAAHEDLFARRQQRSLARWARVIPGAPPATAQDDEIFVLGNVPPDRVEAILTQLGEATAAAKKQLKAPAKEPLLQGGFTVFVLASRYDYSEFGRMTENRELPKDWLGHWHADPLDVYGVLFAEADGDPEQAEGIALQVVSGAYVGSFKAVPNWFAEGVARNLVRNTYRRGDKRVLAWMGRLPLALPKVENAKMLLEGRLDEETSGLVGMSLTHWMMDRANRRRFDQLLELLRAGQPFEAACTATYAPPEVLVKTWLGK